MVNATAANDGSTGSTGSASLYAGWLKKAGGIFGNQQQPRWVELRGQQLLRSKAPGKRLRGVIDLDASVTITQFVDKATFALEVGPTLYTFTAASTEECNDWIHRIQAACRGGEACSHATDGAAAAEPAGATAAQEAEEEAEEEAQKEAEEEADEDAVGVADGTTEDCAGDPVVAASTLRYKSGAAVAVCLLAALLARYAELLPAL